MASPEDLLNDLDNPQTRVAAIITLGEMVHLPALERLLSFAHDSDPQVRRAVMLALASFEGDRVMAAIIGGLHDSDETVRSAAEAAWAKWMLKNMLQLANADRGYVVMKNTQTGTLEYRAGEKVAPEQITTPEFRVSQTVIQETVRSQEAILTDNASADNRFSGGEGIVGFALRQIIAVPLKSGDEVVGVIYVDKRLRDGMLKAEELPALTDFAEQAVASTTHPLPMAEAPEAFGGDEIVMDDSLRGGAAEPEPLLEEVNEKVPKATETLAPDDLPNAEAPDGTVGGVIVDDFLANVSDNEPDELNREKEAAEIQIPTRSTEATPEKADTAPESDPKPANVPTKSERALASEVNFSAYYPADAVVTQQQGLYVYAHLPELAPMIEKDVKQFREQLGGNVPAARVAKQTAQLQHGTLITVMPECDELDFEPAAVTKKWNGEWTRFDFTFTPKAEMVGDSLFVRVSITVSGVEIAHIKCPIEVIAQPSQIQVDNPLAAAKLATQTARMYHRIFVSYSRKDTQVAEAYRLAQMAIGNDVFMDSYSIRVGEDWRAALARAIDEADIFQLFWSSHAAESDNVHDEWDYALKYKCPDQNCTYFIRPVFWDKPMPQPPQPLSHLNFRYVPFALANKDASE